ncbi:hypothetical protein MOK15_14220 [Sphingobium sp. BYY-5]|uniref:hypothetical protein n=1 Tax=Sphingobium sp. BYY-5 TaxID=2926400 RepID=UPI001FA79E6D|nr:hypothetical protein [Sphingobium sp. BYY-5]MCI4591242.1 hypothetical protein [Sphingobium sp. BYY-5]
MFRIDPEEAIDNIDRAFEAKLEAFHTLYDASKAIFPYFQHGDATLLIAVRNAIHHRDHPLFHSMLRTLHLGEGGIGRLLGASFLLAGHPSLHGASVRMSHHFRLNDIDARLDPSLASPYMDSFLKGAKAIERRDLIDQQLGLPAIREFRSRHGFPVNQTYIDLMPIFVSATCKVFKAMEAAGIAFKGFDARTYRTPFTSELAIDLNKHEFSQLILRGWGPLDLIPVPVE